MLYFAKTVFIRVRMSFTQVMPALFSGARIFVKPRPSAVFARCFIFGTARISPARLNSPNTAVPTGTGTSVRAEYIAAARAASTALSLSRIPPATFM